MTETIKPDARDLGSPSARRTIINPERLDATERMTGWQKDITEYYNTGRLPMSTQEAVPDQYPGLYGVGESVPLPFSHLRPDNAVMFHDTFTMELGLGMEFNRHGGIIVATLALRNHSSRSFLITPKVPNSILKGLAFTDRRPFTVVNKEFTSGREAVFKVFVPEDVDLDNLQRAIESFHSTSSNPQISGARMSTLSEEAASILERLKDPAWIDPYRQNFRKST